MYAFVLFIHSWLRWVVVLAALWVVLRAARALGLLGASRAPFAARDDKLIGAFVGLVDLQFLIGLGLYLFLSPMVQGAFADMRAAMRSAPLRFFAIEHITAMVIAVALAHVGRARQRRADEDTKRWRNALLASSGFLLFALIGMPWPVLKHGRPLLRTTLLTPALPATRAAPPELYEKRCAACHGTAGRGDGVAAAAMEPRPRDFAEVRWQSTVTDEQLRRVIREGGTARALSASMPAHPDLRPAQLAELVRFVRSCSQY